MERIRHVDGKGAELAHASGAATRDDSPSQDAPPDPRWYLESLRRTEDGPWQIRISGSSFRVGRSCGLDLTLRSDAVSKVHAEIRLEGNGLRLRDLGSRNGTYVNLDRVQETTLTPGDIVSFAGLDFRVEQGRVDAGGDAHTRPLAELAERTRRAKLLPDLLSSRLVDVVFQPLVALDGERTLGAEVLGRGRHPELPESPRELFHSAADLGRSAELSAAFRRRAAEVLASQPTPWPVFVNSIPAELEPSELSAALGELRAAAPRTSWVLEVHESAIVAPEAVHRLREVLGAHDVALAFDDFGAGQARLMELGEAPPDFLKFDRIFVHGLERASDSRLRLLRSLVRVAHELGAQCVAEGVENAQQAEVCRELGFDTAQGYHFGRPGALESLLR